MNRVTWPEDLLATDIGRLIKDPVTDSVLLAGVRAKCGIFHGTMSKIVPHTTTGKPVVFLSGPDISAHAASQACVFESCSHGQDSSFVRAVNQLKSFRDPGS